MSFHQNHSFCIGKIHRNTPDPVYILAALYRTNSRKIIEINIYHTSEAESQDICGNTRAQKPASLVCFGAR